MDTDTLAILDIIRCSAVRAGVPLDGICWTHHTGLIEDLCESIADAQDTIDSKEAALIPVRPLLIERFERFVRERDEAVNKILRIVEFYIASMNTVRREVARRVANQDNRIRIWDQGEHAGSRIRLYFGSGKTEYVPVGSCSGGELPRSRWAADRMAEIKTAVEAVTAEVVRERMGME